MTTLSGQKRDQSFVGGLIPQSSRRTSTTAEAEGKEWHLYKPLPKQFRHDGFAYREIAREKDLAIYEQKSTDCAEQTCCYEVVLIRHRAGFRIGSRFIPPAEVYPRGEQWGHLGWTFCDQDAAFAKLRALRSEP